MSWLEGEPKNTLQAYLQTHVGQHKLLSEIYWEFEVLKTPVANDDRFFHVCNLGKQKGVDDYKYAVWIRPECTKKLPDSLFSSLESPGEEKPSLQKPFLFRKGDAFVIRNKGNWDCVITKVKEDLDETLKNLYGLERIENKI